jgi:signal peptidase I
MSDIAATESTLETVARLAPRRRSFTALLEAAAGLLRLVVIAVFVVGFIAQPLMIPSESMEQSLLPGDFVLVDRVVYSPAGLWRYLLPYGNVHRGDVVVFRSPLKQGDYMVKRVIGLPGDHLQIQDSDVYINGDMLHEPYHYDQPDTDDPFPAGFPAKEYPGPAVDPRWWNQLQHLSSNGELIIPDGKYFVMGDNRNRSRDSRFWGLVDRKSIVARPLIVYLSLRQGDSVDDPSDDRLSNKGGRNSSHAAAVRAERFFLLVH